jgi:hypothetical protein
MNGSAQKPSKKAFENDDHKAKELSGLGPVDDDDWQWSR